MKLRLSRMRTAWRVLLRPEGGTGGVPRGKLCAGMENFVHKGDRGTAGAVPVHRRLPTPLCPLRAAANAALGSLRGKMGDWER